MPEGLLDLVVVYAIRVIGVIVIFLLALAIGTWAKRKTRKKLEESSSFDRTLSKFLSNLVYYAILVFAGLACLNLFGIDVTSFVAILAAAGFAVGLAFQGTLSNFAAGVMLLIFRPFGVGDKVSVGGETGVVDEIGLFSTTLDTPDNRRLIMPNSSIYGETIENVTHHDTRRVDVAVGTDYDADIASTREVLLDAAAQVEGRLRDQEPVAYLNELGGSSINWSVRVWSTTNDYWDVRARLTQAVKNALDSAEIGIPYPNMDVHLDGALDENGHASDGHAQPSASSERSEARRGDRPA